MAPSSDGLSAAAKKKRKADLKVVKRGATRRRVANRPAITSSTLMTLKPAPNVQDIPPIELAARPPASMAASMAASSARLRESRSAMHRPKAVAGHIGAEEWALPPVTMMPPQPSRKKPIPVSMARQRRRNPRLSPKTNDMLAVPLPVQPVGEFRAVRQKRQVMKSGWEKINGLAAMCARNGG